MIGGESNSSNGGTPTLFPLTTSLSAADPYLPIFPAPLCRQRTKSVRRCESWRRTGQSPAAEDRQCSAAHSRPTGGASHALKHQPRRRRSFYSDGRCCCRATFLAHKSYHGREAHTDKGGTRQLADSRRIDENLSLHRPLPLPPHIHRRDKPITLWTPRFQMPVVMYIYI